MTVEISKKTFTNLQEKQAWIIQMRLSFCVRQEFPETKQIIHSDGSLNQEYFQPPKGMVLQEPQSRSWTDQNRLLLIQGIEEHGIGQFRKISQQYLPDWVSLLNQTPNELRLKTIRLIGRQNLQLYKGWKGNEMEIKQEFEYNKQIGLEFNSWKSNVLVYDDDGLVLDALKNRKRKKLE
jgi:hypothetical protein